MRIAAILQLCLVFTIIASALCTPWAERHLEQKVRTALYDKLSSHPLFESEEVSDASPTIPSRPLSPFLKGWLFFAFLVSLFLLLQIQGARHAAYLLPLLAIAWIATRDIQVDPFVPSEKTIVTDYLDAPLGNRVAEQRAALVQGWQKYLTIEWAKEFPNEEQLEEQAARGEFFFNKARLQYQGPIAPHYQAGVITLALFLIWNVLFVWVIKESPRQSARSLG